MTHCGSHLVLEVFLTGLGSVIAPMSVTRYLQYGESPSKGGGITIALIYVRWCTDGILLCDYPQT